MSYMYTPISPLSPLSQISATLMNDFMDDSIDTFSASILSPFNPNSPLYHTVPLQGRRTSNMMSQIISPGSPMSAASASDVLVDSPVLASLNLTYSKPAFGFYQNMNADPELHNKMVKHFYFFKTLGDWLYDDLLNTLNYIVLDKKSKNIRLIKHLKDLDQHSVDKDTNEIIEKKIKFVKENILGKNDMMYILNHLVRKLKMNWYDLPHNEKVVIEATRKFMTNKMKSMVSK
jgi:hypothetical protein